MLTLLPVKFVYCELLKELMIYSKLSSNVKKETNKKIIEYKKLIVKIFKTFFLAFKNLLYLVILLLMNELPYEGPGGDANFVKMLYNMHDMLFMY